MFLSGRPFCRCSQPPPAFGLRNAPSREASTICLSGVMVRVRMLLTKGARLFDSFHVAPLFVDTKTLLRVATAIISPSLCTETKSVLPITGPPLQLWPLFEDLYSPAEVAAYHSLPLTATSLTRAESTDRAIDFPLFENFFSSMLLIGLQVEALCPRENMPRLVPAMISPFEACFKVKTSRPSRPALFCIQCWPPSCD